MSSCSVTLQMKKEKNKAVHIVKFIGIYRNLL